jgi:tetratricopeptide (TPR) repeat protein
MPRLLCTLSLVCLLLTLPACGRPADTSAPVATGPKVEDTGPATKDEENRTKKEDQAESVEIVIQAAQLPDRKLEVRDCLLRLKLAQLYGTTALPSEEKQLAALTDNDARTAALVTATGEAPLELVYGFGEQTVTPMELIVLLPERIPPGAAAARVEVLGSSVSPVTGYQFLRADPLEASERVQRFKLRPQGAKWVMLRFLPTMRSQRVAVAEIALLGKPGVPASAYSFKEAPVQALELLTRLKAIKGVQLALTDDEAKLVADVENGRFRSASLAEAALLAGGIRDSQKRKHYLDKIDALAEQVKKHLAEDKSSVANGEKLLGWLHAGAMTKGYKADQSDLHVILDGQTFNCLSSAILYVALAHKLGLDARGIEVPDHAFAIVYDGNQHADVETTTRRGFNPSRDPEVVNEFEKITRFVYIPDSNRDKRREVREAGLVALVYYNHGVGLVKQGRYPEALAAFFRALSLDREQMQSVHNALVTLTLWGLDLSKRGRFDEALAVVAAGIELAPRDAGLNYARVEVWFRYADAELGKNGEEAALAVLRQAGEAVPDGPFSRLQAWLTIRKGEPLVKGKKWEEALALVPPALPKIDPEGQKELRQWQAGVYVGWSRSELEAGRFEQALAVLERGIKEFPKDGRFPALLGATAHDWARQTQFRDDAKQVREAIADLRTKHPNQPALEEAAKQMAFWLVIELQEKGKHEEALSAIRPGGPLYPGEADARELLRAVYDNWAWTFIQKKDWKGAFEVYAKALEKHPDDPHLKANLAWVVHQWLSAVEKDQGPEKMKALMAQVKKEHGKLADYIGISAAKIWEGIQALKKEGRYREARELLDRQRELLRDPKKARDMYLVLFDGWAHHHVEAGEQPTAINVYEDALRQFPGDQHLENNLAVVVQRWTLKLQKEGDEARAKEILLQSLVRFAGAKKIEEVARDHVPLLVQDLRQDGKYEEALAALARHRDLLLELHGEKAREAELRLARDVYHVWADSFADKEEWDKALDIYRNGLKRYPKYSELLEGGAGVWDRRARKHFEPKEWDKAIEVYDLGLKEFPESRLLKHNREVCVQRKKRAQG